MIVVWLGVGKYRERLVDFFEQHLAVTTDG
jgi:hypothetical protein